MFLLPILILSTPGCAVSTETRFNEYREVVELRRHSWTTFWPGQAEETRFNDLVDYRVNLNLNRTDPF